MDYHKQADDFLKRYGLEFRAVLVGDDCPMFCEDKNKETCGKVNSYKGTAHMRCQLENNHEGPHRDGNITWGQNFPEDVTTFPRKTHIHGKHYRCTISGANRGHVSFDFWNSYADEEQNFVNGKGMRFVSKYKEHWDMIDKYKGKGLSQVRAYDLLACITKSDPGDFEEFCRDFGYDTDSRKALTVYEAVCKEWRKVQRFFRPEEIEALQEIS